jgi:hypothetical protein
MLNLKEPGKVFTGNAPNLLDVCAVKLSQTPRRFNHPGRFISLSSKRHWREIRTIGFDQQAIEWKLTCDLPQVLGVLERQVTRE